MKTSLRSALPFLLALGCTAFVATGCQTTKGFGRDVEHVGEKIQGHSSTTPKGQWPGPRPRVVALR